MTKFFCFGKNDFCDDKTKCFRCDFHDGNGGEEREYIKTIADRIRSMSDEELAVFIADEIPHGDCYGCELGCVIMDKGKFENSCQKAHYDWLKQPYKEEK